MSKLSMVKSREMLEYFGLESRDSEIKLPDAAEVKTFIQESLLPSMIIFREKFFIMSPM